MKQHQVQFAYRLDRKVVRVHPDDFFVTLMLVDCGVDGARGPIQ